jgi:hypothetical protein
VETFAGMTRVHQHGLKLEITGHAKAKIARRRARKQNSKQIELFDQQLVEGIEDSDDCSSISSLCWGSSMDSLGGESALEDGLGFDIDVF